MKLKSNPDNQRLKHEYLTYLREARGMSQGSLDAVAAAISRFEQYTGARPFKKFHIQQAVGFKEMLRNSLSARDGKPLSKATISSTLNHVRSFFVWLAGQPKFRSVLKYGHADYFSLTEKEARAAKASSERPVPSVEDVVRLITTAPAATPVQRRDRAVIALLLLTGARDGAVASLSVKHVDFVEGRVHFDGREVKTKFSKTFKTWFFPVPQIAREVLEAWVGELRQDHGFGSEDPLFPATRVAHDEDRQFVAVGLSRDLWSSADPIRELMKAACARAGLPAYHPHSIRKTLARLGEQICTSPEQFKAWSQNLGHEEVMTTLMSYGAVPERRQSEIIRALGQQDETEEERRVLDAVRAAMRKT